MQCLEAVDEAITEQVRAEGCRHCGGRLDRADYPRKPRGGAIAPGVEGWCTRPSLCCSREGCRRRATPPSVRFLGPRVYAEVVVVLASIAALVSEQARELRNATGVPVRTVRRWSAWWRTAFVAGALWLEACARLVPPPAQEQLPASLLSRFAPATALGDMARFLAALTTASVPDGSRFVRLAM